jgi:hypothetical protein
MMRSASWSRGRHAGCHAQPEDHHAWEERGPIGSTNVRDGKQREPRGHDHRAEGQGQSLAVVVATGDIDVIAPGFAADSLETLEEIAIRYASLYRSHGGGELRYIPALNDSPGHIKALASLLRRHLRGWAPGPRIS